MRCPDCNKFVSYDEPEMEVEDSEVTESGITGSVNITLPCIECGTTLREGSIDFDIDIELKEDIEYEIVEIEVEYSSYVRKLKRKNNKGECTKVTDGFRVYGTIKPDVENEEEAKPIQFEKVFEYSNSELDECI